MKLNQVIIAALDVIESAEFYVNLGCKMVVEGVEYARLLAPDGGSTFSLFRTDKIADTSVCHLYFELETAQALNEKVKQLQAKKFAEFTDPEDKRWLWREARVVDPSGFTVILYHAGDNRLHPPWGVLDKPKWVVGTKPRN